MKYRILTCVFIISFFVTPILAQKKESNKGFPEFSWDTMPLYMHLRKATKFTKKEIKYLSKYPLITFEKTTGSTSYGSTELGTLEAAKKGKKINPDAKILYYKNVVINWGGYKEDASFLKTNPRSFSSSIEERELHFQDYESHSCQFVLIIP